MLPIYSDADINGWLAVDQARLNISTPSTLDLPRTWAKVKGGFLTYNEPSSSITLPNSVDACNILHINAYGTKANEYGITQIASSHTGHLYYRNGDATGWWGSSESPKDKTTIWRELIDNKGGQTINGSLTIDWKKLRDISTDDIPGDIISDRCAQLCGVTQLNTANDTLEDDLDRLFIPHVYVNTKSATITNNSGIDSYNYPLNKAGLLTVYNTLQYHTTPSWNKKWPGVRGAIQTYMPHDLNTVAMRSIRYIQDDYVSWNPWNFFTPSTMLADHVTFKTLKANKGDDDAYIVLGETIYNGFDETEKIQIGESCCYIFIASGWTRTCKIKYNIDTNTKYNGWILHTNSYIEEGENKTSLYRHFNYANSIQKILGLPLNATDFSFNLSPGDGQMDMLILWAIRTA